MTEGDYETKTDKRQAFSKFGLCFFHDDENYYVDGFLGFKEPTPTSVQRSGTIINGRTGQVYSRSSKSWEADPRKTNSTSADGAVALKRALQGKWQIVSAGYQTTSSVFYTFEGETLTIESRQYQEKRAGAPWEDYVSKWAMVIDDTALPSRLVMTRLDQPPMSPSNGGFESRTEAFELRNGELWMCRDSGDPITSDSLQPGAGGWVTGLRRVE